VLIGQVFSSNASRPKFAELLKVRAVYQGIQGCQLMKEIRYQG